MMNHVTQTFSSTWLLLLVLTATIVSRTLSAPQGFSSPLKKIVEIRDKRVTENTQLARELFRKGDLDGNEALTQTEISHFYRNFVDFPQSLADFTATGFLRNGDRNRDNQLNFDETLIAIRAIRG